MYLENWDSWRVALWAGKEIQERGGHCICFSKSCLDFLSIIYWLVCSLIYSFFFFYSLTTKLNIKFLLRCWEILKRAWVNGETSCVHCLGDLISLRWYAPQIVVQTQSNTYQNSSFLLCRSWQANFKIHMKIEGIKNSHNNLGGGAVEDSHFPISKPITKL